MPEIIRTRRSRFFSSLTHRSAGSAAVVFLCVLVVYSTCRWYLDDAAAAASRYQDVPRVWEVYDNKWISDKAVQAPTSRATPFLQRIGAQVKNVRALETGKIEVSWECYESSMIRNYITPGYLLICDNISLHLVHYMYTLYNVQCTTYNNEQWATFVLWY